MPTSFREKMKHETSSCVRDERSVRSHGGQLLAFNPNLFELLAAAFSAEAAGGMVCFFARDGETGCVSSKRSPYFEAIPQKCLGASDGCMLTIAQDLHETPSKLSGLLKEQFHDPPSFKFFLQ